MNTIQNACGACGQFFTSDQADEENLHLAEFCSAVDIYDPKCCEDSDDHEYSDDCECCINVCRDCAEPMDKWNPMKEGN